MNEHATRRAVLKATAAGIAGTAAMSAPASASGIGLHDCVFANEGTAYLHHDPDTATDYATRRENTGMFTIDGPVDNDGFRWWYCEVNGDYDSYQRDRAWVAEKELDPTPFAYGSDDRFTASHCDGRGHDGVDVAHTSGQSRPVLAARGGTAYTSWRSGYGRTIEIEHGDGWSTLYAHLSTYLVSNGEQVGQFQRIGETGATGGDYNTHLHQEVRRYDSPLHWPHRTYDRHGNQIAVWYRSGMPNKFSYLSC